MKRTLTVTAALIAVLGACSRPDLDTRTFDLRYLDEEQAAEVIQPYVYTDREGAPGGLSYGAGLLTVRETPDNLAKIERVLSEHDRPSPMLQLRFQLIEADGAAREDPRIADVTAELSRLFRFAGYTLLDETVMGATAGASVANVLANRFRIGVEVFRVSGGPDEGTVELLVSLDALGSVSAFRTTVTVPLGKTAVLGNVRMDVPRNPLILTVRPEMLQPGDPNAGG